MNGLSKPASQQHASRRTRNPGISSNLAGNDGHLTSCYHGEKEEKHKQQTKDRMKKWLVWIALGNITLAVFRMQSSASKNDSFALLRSGKPEGDVSQELPNDASSLSEPIAISREDPLPEKSIPAKGITSSRDSIRRGTLPQQAGPRPAEDEHRPFSKRAATQENEHYCIPVSNHYFADPKNSEPVNIEKGADNRICGRELPINLEELKKPIPVYLGGHKDVVLLKNEKNVMDLGSRLSSFFHAYDFAYTTNRPLYITKDSWALDTLFPLFFGPSSAVEKNAELWTTMEDSLGVTFVENEEALTSMGLKVAEYKSQGMLFNHLTHHFDASKYRYHRTKILRRLFQYPSQQGSLNVCSTMESLLGYGKEKKYTVIHLAGYNQKFLLPFLNKGTGKDHAAASSMQPEYVKNILKRLDMLQHDIYPIDTTGTPVDVAAYARLAKDPELSSQLKCVADKQLNNDGGNLYLAVLADVYLGNPLDHTSMWVARMRYALGMKNTFIFTEQQGDQWVSYIDNDDHLDLYDSKKLGIWMG